MKHTLLIALSVLLSASTFAQPWAQLVKDACPGAFGNASFPYTFNNKIYYMGYDEPHGNELWVSDGTTTGTKMLVDINTNGQDESNPFNFVSGGNKLFFMARSQGSTFHKFFVTDGTETGTISPKNISVTNRSYVLNGDAYFVGVEKDSTRLALWRSDGTVTGTVALANMDADITGAVVCRNKLFMTSELLRRLWVTDGTGAGTRQLYSDTIPVYPPAVLNNKVCFAARGLINTPNGIYATDGVTTQLLEDNFVVSSFSEMNGRLYYVVQTRAGFTELHTTDGTITGTYSVKKVATVRPFFDRMYVVGNTLAFFVSNDIVISDGTEAGTWSMRIPAKLNLNVYPEVSGGNLFFATRDSGSRCDLWITDGTLTGLHRVDSAYYISNTFDVDSKPQTFKVANGKVYFEATKQQPANGVYFPRGTRQLYSSDGRSIQPVMPAITIADSYFEYALLNNNLYITANDSISGTELWKITDFPTGVPELNSKTQQQNIYPNPANNTFSIKAGNANNTTVKIFSLTGQLLFQTQQTQNISITQLPAGIYMVQLSADGIVHTEKLVKE